MCRLFLFALFPIFAVAQQQTIESQIRSVLVYPNAAEITRAAQIDLNAGTQIIRVINLPSDLRTEDLRVSLNGKAQIHNITYDRFPDIPSERFPDLQTLQKKLLDVKERLRYTEAEKAALTLQIKTLEAFSNQPQNLNTNSDLSATLSIVGKERSRIGKELINAEKVLAKLAQEQKRTTDSVNYLESRYRLRLGYADIEVHTNSQTKLELSLRYPTPRASWYSTYEARIKTDEGKIEFIQTAQIKQQTGEDWLAIPLTFSSSIPKRGVSLPPLNPWRLNLQTDQVVQTIRSQSNKALESNATKSVITGDMPAQYGDAGTFSESEVGILIALKTPQTIASNPQEQRVQLRTFLSPCSYQYVCRPFLSPAVYRMAYIRGWEQLDLQKGLIKVYQEGLYLGETYLNPNIAEDSLALALGEDPLITVTVKHDKDFTKQRSLSKTKTETHTRRIEILNQRDQIIKLLIEERYPISGNSAIEIKLLESEGAKVDKVKGFLGWHTRLEPGISQEFSFRYNVSYPADQRLR